MKIDKTLDHMTPLVKTQTNSNPHFKENGSSNRDCSINKNKPVPPVVFSDPIGFGLTKRIPFRYKPFAIGISIATVLGSLPEMRRFVIASFFPKLYLLTNKSRHHFVTRILNSRIDSNSVKTTLLTN
ncbi:hypothetical protein HOG98_05160 [bacterium]|nr:hypothetical protein [bacterium]